MAPPNVPTDAESPVKEGDLIAGKYRVSRTLGVGGMGIVVAAVHVDLKQKVALKFLLPEALEQPELVERFAREARAAAQIQSEHVARVTDVGRLESGAPYMVMEYLDGKDVGDLLEKHGPVRREVAVGYILQACEAIAEAHALGIVHRDLKPGNLYLAKKPNGTTVLKVLDFGISKSTIASNEADLTHGSAMVGSPSYMAPEQIKAARSVDVRADQWSLGVILYELLSGKKPFPASTMSEMVWAILDRPQVPLRSVSVDTPVELEQVIDRCLAKEPAGRFESVAELVHALAPYGPVWSASSVERTCHALGASPDARPTELPVLVAEPVALPGTPARAAAPLGTSTASLLGPQPVAFESVTNPPWSQVSAVAHVPPLPPLPGARNLVMPVAVGTLALGALLAAVVMTQLAPGSDSTSLPPTAAGPGAAPSPSPSTAAPLPVPAPPPTGLGAIASPPAPARSPAASASGAAPTPSTAP